MPMYLFSQSWQQLDLLHHNHVVGDSHLLYQILKFPTTTPGHIVRCCLTWQCLVRKKGLLEEWGHHNEPLGHPSLQGDVL